VLLGQLHGHSLQDLLVVALQSSVEHTITIDDDESEGLVILKQSLQWLGIEPVLALVSEHSLGHERLKVDSHLLLRLAVLEHDDTAENNETVWWVGLVQLQL
jgi:hypothetical protein